MYEEMMPIGKRIYELTSESMKIDKSANEGCSLSYELYVADFEQMADGFARRLNDTENKFFETVCSIGNNYRPPSKREENEQSAYEIRRDLSRELYGEEEEYDASADLPDHEYDQENERLYGSGDMTDKEAQRINAAYAEIKQLQKPEMSHEQDRIKYASGREARLKEMAKTTKNILSVEHVSLWEGHQGSERNITYKMSHEQDMIDYAKNWQRMKLPDRKDDWMRIVKLESWILEVISKPSMSRELRLEGLDLVEGVSPQVRQSVERICSPSQGLSMEQGWEQSII